MSRTCDTCGGPLGGRNKYGACTMTKRCREVHDKRLGEYVRQRDRHPTRKCSICGGPLHKTTVGDICTQTFECRSARGSMAAAIRKVPKEKRVSFKAEPPPRVAVTNRVWLKPEKHGDVRLWRVVVDGMMTEDWFSANKADAVAVEKRRGLVQRAAV